MRYMGKVLLSSSLLLMPGTNISNAASMGSLAPHDVASRSTGQQQQQWVSDPVTGCRALDSDFDANDSVSWQGKCADGFAWGLGTLTFLSNGRVLESITGKFAWGTLQPGHVSAVWSDGSKYDGSQLGGQFDGDGMFTSATGDKLDGTWRAGALNGHASVVWANGDRYDGDWKDGKSDGHGTEVWADGRRFEGLWSEGKPSGSDATAATATPSPVGAPVPPAPPTAVALGASPAPVAATYTTLSPDRSGSTEAEPAAQAVISTSLPFAALMGTKLVAVDGSTVELSPNEDGVVRTVTLPNGVEQQVSFSIMSGRIGTVSSESSAVGLFRTTPHELDIDFSDGTIEVMKPDADGGLFVSSRSADGASSCTNWYPEGHAFGDTEKKAAVLQYAARLGVSLPASTKKGRPAHSPAQSCGGAVLEKFSPAAVTTASTTGGQGADPDVTNVHAPQPAPTEKAPDARTDSAGLQNVPVKPSTVHLIDAADPAKSPPPALQVATFSVSAPPAPLPAKEAESHDSQPQVASNASQCLSVQTDGEYWGFQNICSKTLQFAYCEMSEKNPLTACGRASVSGSVGPHGFGALVSEKGLADQGDKHEFRWMACDGGAGEVVARLDSVDPPVGRCLRAVASAGP